MFFREGLKRLYNMLTAEDKVLLAGKGITEEQIEAARISLEVNP